MREHRYAGSVLAAALLTLAGLIALGGFLDLFGEPNKANAPALRSSAPAAAPDTLLSSGLFSWPPPWPSPTLTPVPPAPEQSELPPAVEEPVIEPAPAPTDAPPVPAQQPPAQYQDYALASGVIDYVSAARAANGLGSLSQDGALAAAAQAYAQYLVETNQFTHDAQGGLLARIRAAGYGGGYAGEAIWEGWGNYTAADIVSDWLNSPPHREILLSATYVQFGVGCYVSDNKRLCVLDAGAQ